MFRAIILSMLIFFGACAVQPQVAPKTPDQIAYSAYGLYITVENTVSDSLQVDSITAEKAIDIKSRLAAMRPAIEAARIAAANGKVLPQNQIEALQKAQQILMGIQKDLMAKQQGITANGK